MNSADTPASLEALLTSGEDAGRIFPPPLNLPADEVESLDEWGFADSGFTLNANGHATFTGKRYGLSGLEMPVLVPWVSEMMQVTVQKDVMHTPQARIEIPEPVSHPAFLAAAAEILAADQMTQDARIRLRHGHGHTQEEMYNIKYGRLKRVPDLVVYPSEEEQVAALVQAAVTHNVVLIPFGGGTSVTEALACPEDEQRLIVSVDMKRMNRICGLIASIAWPVSRRAWWAAIWCVNWRAMALPWATSPTALSFRPWAAGLPPTPAA